MSCAKRAFKASEAFGRSSEHLVTRDFSRESCQPLTRHCELALRARNIGFEPVSAAVFWIFRLEQNNALPSVHLRRQGPRLRALEHRQLEFAARLVEAQDVDVA